MKKVFLFGLAVILFVSAQAQLVGVVGDRYYLPETQSISEGELIPGDGDRCYYVYSDLVNCNIYSFDESLKLLANKKFKYGDYVFDHCLGVVRLRDGLGIMYTNYDNKTKTSYIKLDKLDPNTLVVTKTLDITSIPDKAFNYSDYDAQNTDTRITMVQSEDYSKIAVVILPHSKAYDKATPNITVIDDAGDPVWKGSFETNHPPHAFYAIGLVLTNAGSLYMSAHRADMQHTVESDARSIFAIDSEGRKMVEYDMQKLGAEHTFSIAMHPINEGALLSCVISNKGVMLFGVDANSGNVLVEKEFMPNLTEWKANAWYEEGNIESLVGMYFSAASVLQNSKGELYILDYQQGGLKHDAMMTILIRKLNPDFSLAWTKWIPMVQWSGQVRNYQGVEAFLLNDELNIMYSFIEPSKIDYPLFTNGTPTDKLEHATKVFNMDKVDPGKGVPMSEFLTVHISPEGEASYKSLRQNEYTIDGVYPKEQRVKSPGVDPNKRIQTEHYFIFTECRQEKVVNTNSTKSDFRLWQVPIEAVKQ